MEENNGDKHIWSVLDERFPDKQKHDWMAECLREVFQITSSEGETMTAWTSRVQEVFSKCQRKVSVDFPTEARGWICLHASGLNEDQRAIVTAKTQGDLKLDTVMAAMRSCFPDFKAPGKVSRSRNSVAYVVEEDTVDQDLSFEEPEKDLSDGVVLDVEAFLADHGVREDTTAPSEIFEEAEVAEILAATWREKRNEISRRRAGNSHRHCPSRSSSHEMPLTCDGSQNAGIAVRWDIGPKTVPCRSLHQSLLVLHPMEIAKRSRQQPWSFMLLTKKNPMRSCWSRPRVSESSILVAVRH